MSLQLWLALSPYSHCIPTAGQLVPPEGAADGHTGFAPPLLEPLPEPPLEPPLDPLLEPLPEPPPPELPELLPEPPLEPEPPPELPEPDPLPPSVPPSVFPTNVAPPHAHIAAAPATTQSLACMSRTSRPCPTQMKYQLESEQLRADPLLCCAAPRTPTSWYDWRPE
jgi:protein TonB